MPEDSLQEKFQKVLALEDLQDKIALRMNSFKSEEEKQQVNSLIRRAFSGECEFDRRHKADLITLAIAPHEVSWQFKLRERLHRYIHHH